MHQRVEAACDLDGELDLHRQVLPVVGDEVAQPGRREGALPGEVLQDDRGSRFGQRLLGEVHAPRSVRAAQPAHGGGVGPARGAREHRDRRGDHEAGEQADPELAEVVRARQAELVALGRGADGGEEGASLLSRQADARVDDAQSRAVRLEADAGRAVGIDLPARRDGVRAVLQELPDEDLRPRIEVAAEQIDQPGQVHLEVLGRRSPARRLTVRHLSPPPRPSCRPAPAALRPPLPARPRRIPPRPASDGRSPGRTGSTASRGRRPSRAARRSTPGR